MQYETKEHRYYVYKTTNKKNGKFYVGVHRSSDITNDAYLGSGHTMLKAIKKYGPDSFEREIITHFDNYQEAFELEELIVDKEFVDREDTYNLAVGGKGFYFESKEDHPMYGKTHSEEFKNNLSEKRKRDWEDPEYREMMIQSRAPYCQSDEGKEALSRAAKALWENPESVNKMKNARKKTCGTEEYKILASESAKKREEDFGNGFKGKSHSTETRKRMSESKKKLWSSSQHPMVGRKHSEESKNKMSESRRNLPDVVCPHCSKTGKPAGMRRWHFDNCKYKLE